MRAIFPFSLRRIIGAARDALTDFPSLGAFQIVPSTFQTTEPGVAPCPRVQNLYSTNLLSLPFSVSQLWVS